MMQCHYTKLLRAMLTAPLMLVAISGAAIAGQLEDALAAHSRSDDATALRLVRSLADRGNAEAQYNVSIVYVTGKGLPKNGAEAAKWFCLAADQVYAAARRRRTTKLRGSVKVVSTRS